MKLFEVQAGTRVRLSSRRVRLKVTDEIDVVVSNDATFEATVTDSYLEWEDCQRRLLVDLSVNFWRGYGIWQRDCECEIIK